MNRVGCCISRNCIPAQRGENARGRISSRRSLWLPGRVFAAVRVLVPAAAEVSESLEQLRALANDAWIQIEPAPEPVPAGVDTEADLEAMRAHGLGSVMWCPRQLIGPAQYADQRAGRASGNCHLCRGACCGTE